MRLACLWCMLLYCFSCQGGWIRSNTGFNTSFTSVCFTSADTGYISGDSGVIIKTTNGGSSWSKLKSGTNATLYCIYFINSFTGYACGDSGTILKTVDGGKTWQRQNSHINFPLYTITFSGNNAGYAGGGLLGKGYILKTTDGGMNWDTLNTGAFTLKSYEHTVYSIHFPSLKTGYATIRNAVLKTADGGVTWHEINRALSLADSLSSILQTCYFISEDTGFTAGYYSPILAETTDGGAIWKRMVSKNAFYKIHFGATGAGYAAGQSYKNTPVIYKTLDRGKTWTLDYEDTASRDHKLSCIFSGATSAYAVGNVAGAFYKKKDDSSGTGVKNNDLHEPDITLYPNPVSSSAPVITGHLSKTVDISKIHVQLCNASGMILRELNYKLINKNSSKNEILIEIQGIKSGMYFIKIITDNQTYSLKAIII